VPSRRFSWNEGWTRQKGVGVHHHRSPRLTKDRSGLRQHVTPRLDVPVDGSTKTAAAVPGPLLENRSLTRPGHQREVRAGGVAYQINFFWVGGVLTAARRRWRRPGSRRHRPVISRRAGYGDTSLRGMRTPEVELGSTAWGWWIARGLFAATMPFDSLRRACFRGSRRAAFVARRGRATKDAWLAVRSCVERRTQDGFVPASRRVPPHPGTPPPATPVQFGRILRLDKTAGRRGSPAGCAGRRGTSRNGAPVDGSTRVPDRLRAPTTVYCQREGWTVRTCVMAGRGVSVHYSRCFSTPPESFVRRVKVDHWVFFVGGVARAG